MGWPERIGGCELWHGDCREILCGLPEESAHSIVTSPPYFGLRDYGIPPSDWPEVSFAPMPGLPAVAVPAMRCCLGLEPDPWAFVGHLVAVFRECRRVLRGDGCLMLNIGDSYAGTGATGGGADGSRRGVEGFGAPSPNGKGTWKSPRGWTIKPKDLLGIPWRVAFALQADGWWLRNDLIWCLSGGAWVYVRTQKGEMPMMVKDLVRLQPSTVQLWNGEKWTHVLGWGRSTDESERVELVLRSGERIGCTGSHLWPTRRGNVTARNLAVGDIILTCRLPEPADCQCPAYLTHDALWLVGLFLAEGSRSDDCMNLALAADEQRWLPRIYAVAEYYGGSAVHSVIDGSLTVRLHGRVIDAILRNYIGGKTAIDKHLKVAAWRLPNEALRCIVDGYLDGDGSHDLASDRHRLGFCRNYALERDLRTLAARLGATLTLNAGTAAYQNGASPCFRGEWRWGRSGHWNERERSEIVEIRASRARQFWDIAVEDEPHLFALASGVLTHNCKPAPMPESVRDRCTRAHEAVFHFAKSERYFWDAEAIAEEASQPPGARKLTAQHKRGQLQGLATSTLGTNQGANARSARSVWTINTEPCAEAHFAVMPSELARRCVLATTSEAGACAECGAPWGRELVVSRGTQAARRERRGKAITSPRHDGNSWNENNGRGFLPAFRRHAGWAPSCACAAEPVPATVLDPFAGAGTTLLAAERLGRRSIGIEASAEFVGIALRRIAGDRCRRGEGDMGDAARLLPTPLEALMAEGPA